MKFADEVSSDKLRGGFYTPQPLVNVCLDRIASLNGGHDQIAVLEPSAGDGAFLRGLGSHPLASTVRVFFGIEIVESEAQKSRALGLTAPFQASIITASTLEWAAAAEEQFDAVVGNPPFVRYQFKSASDKAAIERLGSRMHLSFRRVSNIWIPIFLGALGRLRPGGSMAMVVPAELFTGVSAGDARRWLLENFDNLRVDLFEPGSFGGVLQEVIVISGSRRDSRDRIRGSPAQIEFVDHFGSGSQRMWSHAAASDARAWTRYLLNAIDLDTLAEVTSLPSICPFGDVAKLEVSTVTGANDFFSVTQKKLEEFNLGDWALQMLPRVRHAPGLMYTSQDQQATCSGGADAWLLDFSETRPDPTQKTGPSRYLGMGEERRLDQRYKTSIRRPWYRVPVVQPGKLLLSKRSHRFPRLIYNAARVVTTDTIYQGSAVDRYQGRELDIVSSFHNSLTLLTAELEGRSFGGGVLELVPSEIARLAIPAPVGFSDAAIGLDRIARSTRGSTSQPPPLVEQTDAFLARHVSGLNMSALADLGNARESLEMRRLSRNQRRMSAR